MEEHGTFEAVRTRLDEIVDAVSAEDVTLDEALALYEEAVNLGLSACDLSEKDVEAAFPEEAAGEEGAPAPADAEAAGADVADAASADAEPADPAPDAPAAEPRPQD
ncbi:exodeoxyribonuclease VII small subunit [Adlercreutzia faecimuris]|uniref:Exodeoxyribonuclease VII small subunit n=1 Tax=Adlercreutzia faecimuris TaxID=2897341 RepID=A0ABS9WH59_9ACTN|nr:exodeoxyribonuclease VII small subunit [Adlercreutzia sp. JBNU-10]